MKKISNKIAKIGTSLYEGIVFTIAKASNVFADVSINSDGGKIKNSGLGQGVYNIAQDVSGTLRWLIPVVSVPFILWFLFKMFSGDEQEQPRYKKRLISTLVIVMASTLVTVIINLILSYF